MYLSNILASIELLSLHNVVLVVTINFPPTLSLTQSESAWPCCASISLIRCSLNCAMEDGWAAGVFVLCITLDTEANEFNGRLTLHITCKAAIKSLLLDAITPDLDIAQVIVQQVRLLERDSSMYARGKQSQLARPLVMLHTSRSKLYSPPSCHLARPCWGSVTRAP